MRNMDDLDSIIQKKVYTITHLLLVVFCIVHFVLSCLFMYDKVYILSLYELLSSLFYLILFLVFHRYKTSLVAMSNALQAIIIEFVIHIGLSITLVGTDFKFQHYLYGVLALIMFENYVSRKPKRTGKLLVFACSVSFAAYHYVGMFGSIYEINNIFTKICGVVNPVAVALCISGYIYYFSDLVSRIEMLLTYTAKHDVLTRCYRRDVVKDLDFDNTKSWVAMLDLDNFKRVNDTYGHSAGDAVLQDLGHKLFTLSKDGNDFYAIRWGGEEFVLIYNDPNKPFLELLENLQADIRKSTITVGDTDIQYRATIGVADYSERSTLDDLVDLADNRLYVGKNKEKDRIVSKDEVSADEAKALAEKLKADKLRK